MPAVAVLDRLVVAPVDERVSGRRAEQVEVRGLGLVQAGEEAVDCPEPARRRDDECVQPSPAETVPSGCATVSSARTTVVPTAITRPPQPWTAPTRRAVCSGTRKRSG